jgi:hypothetical protein
MRFLIPQQTISEYRHQKMPVYETIAAVGATTIVGSLTVGGLAGAAATAGAGALAAYGVNAALGSGKGGGGGGVPGYNPQQSLALQQQQFDQMSPQALGFASSLFNQAADQGINFAKRGTKANIANQEIVSPGSQVQRQLATNQINQYIQGQVPQDVQQQINRQVAQNLGGGFNLFSGGGQAPNAFARNIGQTSVGLSQFGLSAAPTWQQLANSMVTKPEVGLQAGIQAGGIGAQLASSAAGIGMQNAENQYQSAFNQYQGQRLQDQQTQQMIMQGASSGLDLYKAAMKGEYLNNLNPSGRGLVSTLGGLPSSSSASSYMSSLGYNPSAMSAVPNTGAGTAYPFD